MNDPSSVTVSQNTIMPTKITDEQKNLLDELFESDRNNLKYWEAILKNAKDQVQYWERQCEHSSAMSLRATMQQW